MQVSPDSNEGWDVAALKLQDNVQYRLELARSLFRHLGRVKPPGPAIPSAREIRSARGPGHNSRS